MIKKKIEITGIIPVKANSERVKNKNLRKFSDSNLFELKLNQLSKLNILMNFMFLQKTKVF